MEALAPRTGTGPAEGELVEVDLVSVEVGAVDARESHLAAHRHPAAAAHPGAVDHDRVQAHDRADPARPRDPGACSHHRQGTDREDFRNVVAVAHGVREDVGDRALRTEGTVVRGDEQLVGQGLEPLRPERAICRSESHDRDRVRAELDVAAKEGEDRRHPEAAAHQDHQGPPLDLRRAAEWSDDVEQSIPFRQLHHLGRGLADRLHHHGERPAIPTSKSDIVRDPLTGLVDPDHDELTRLACPRHRRREDLEQEGRRPVPRPSDDRIAPPALGGAATIVRTDRSVHPYRASAHRVCGSASVQ